MKKSRSTEMVSLTYPITHVDFHLDQSFVRQKKKYGNIRETDADLLGLLFILEEKKGIRRAAVSDNRKKVVAYQCDRQDLLQYIVDKSYLNSISMYTD